MVVLAIDHEQMVGSVMMILTYKIDINDTKSWFKVKVKGQGQICIIQKHCFGYESWTGDWLLMILKHMININEVSNGAEAR